jgi:Flp pilus assembly protein TadB
MSWIVAWTVGVLLVLLVIPATRHLRGAPRRVSGERVRRQLRRHPPPDYAALLDAVARQVRSGSSLTSAIVDEIDPASSLGVVLERLSAGRSLAEALAAADRVEADCAFTVQALSATAHLGGPIAATLDEAAAVLRERVSARAERQAYGAQTRLSARVLTIVPLGFALWSAVASQRTRDVYVATTAGVICALLGMALNLTGWLWMRHIIGPA